MEGDFSLKPRYSQNHNKSFYLVKLTDFAQKLLDKNPSNQIKICFKPNESQGVFKIVEPETANDLLLDHAIDKTVDLNFNVQDLSQLGYSEGTFECVKFKKGNFQALGKIRQKLSVTAHENIYQTTREKMTIADEMSKQTRVKEIKGGAALHSKRKQLQQHHRLKGLSPVTTPSPLSAQFKKILPVSVGSSSGLKSGQKSNILNVPAMKKSSGALNGSSALMNELFSNPLKRSSSISPSVDKMKTSSAPNSAANTPKVTHGLSSSNLLIGANSISINSSASSSNILNHNNKLSVSSITNTTNKAFIAKNTPLQPSSSKEKSAALIPLYSEGERNMPKIFAGKLSDPRSTTNKLGNTRINTIIPNKKAPLNSADDISSDPAHPKTSAGPAEPLAVSSSKENAIFMKNAALFKPIPFTFDVASKSSDNKPYSNFNKLLNGDIVKDVLAHAGSSKTPNKLSNSTQDEVSPPSNEISPPAPSLSGPYHLKDIILHALALRPYKRSELIGLIEKDYPYAKTGNWSTSLTGILNSFGIFNSNYNTYSIARHAYSEIKLELALYSDVEREMVKRKIPMNSSPKPLDGKTPPHIKQLKNLQQQTEHSITENAMASNTLSENIDAVHETKNNAERHKKNKADQSKSANISTKRHKANGIISNDQSLDDDNTQSVNGSISNGHNLDAITFGKSIIYPPLDQDYLTHYQQISNLAQRDEYKAVFDADYNEYLKLHKKLRRVFDKFDTINRKLQALPTGSSEYKELRQKFLLNYRELTTTTSEEAIENNSSDNPLLNTHYIKRRRRFDYLHAKLAHLKNLVNEFDTGGQPFQATGSESVNSSDGYNSFSENHVNESTTDERKKHTPSTTLIRAS